MASEQCFPTFFGSRHPNLVLTISGGTPGWFLRHKDQGIEIVGGTPGTFSRHPSVPRHPGWEPLLQREKQFERNYLFFNTSLVPSLANVSLILDVHVSDENMDLNYNFQDLNYFFCLQTCTLKCI